MRSSVCFVAQLIAAASLFVPVCAHAELRGELRVEGNAPSNARMRVELLDMHGQPAADSPATPDGRFNIAGVAAGEYDLVVSGSDGREIARQRVTARDFSSGLVVSVPGQPADVIHAVTGEAVSVCALQHRPDRETLKLQKQAIAAHERHDHDRTLKLLHEAIARDPGYASAHYLLGLEFALHGDLDSGARELDRAVQLDSASAGAQSAYALVLLHLHDVPKALEHAARAVQLDPRSPKFSYILGVSLVDAGRDGEAMPYLQRASDQVPAARDLAEQIQRKLTAAK